MHFLKINRLHEDSKPLIRSKEVEKQMAPTVDIVTPSEDEKKEAGEVKPSDGQKDEETGVVYVKVLIVFQLNFKRPCDQYLDVEL